MPTKPRTKKPAKATRKPRQAKPSAEEIGCVIGRHAGYTLASCMEDLLSLRDKPGFDAVSAWTVEKLGDGVTGYRANIAEQAMPTKMSPVEESLNRLRAAVIGAECCTDAETERLCSALCPPMTAPTSNKTPQPGAGVLACVLNDLAERIYEDNRRRNELLDRLEL